MNHILSSRGDNSALPIRVLFFGRSQCEATNKALAHLKKLGFEITFVESKGRGDRLSEDIGYWEGDYVLCFRSLFILPKYLLDKAKIAAINFHPAPPEYPGSGCLNFALYDDAKEYGVTAHLMDEKIDNGQILECRRFPILRSDSVDSLLERTHVKLLDLFFDVTTGIGAKGKEYIGAALSQSNHESWRGPARRISELEKLETIPMDISEEELARVIRATYTESFPPRILLHGYVFELKSPCRRQA
jgi:methionyl-tRNA formyltransferase